MGLGANRVTAGESTEGCEVDMLEAYPVQDSAAAHHGSKPTRARQIGTRCICINSRERSPDILRAAPPSGIVLRNRVSWGGRMRPEAWIVGKCHSERILGADNV